MAQSPKYKIFRGKEYIGCVKHLEDAAALVAVSGGEVRANHTKASTLWVEGQEGFPAGEASID